MKLYKIVLGLYKLADQSLAVTASPAMEESDTKLRLKVVKSTDSKDLYKFIEDPDTYIRNYVSENIDPSYIYKFVKDKSDYVRETARLRVQKNPKLYIESLPVENLTNDHLVVLVYALSAIKDDSYIESLIPKFKSNEKALTIIKESLTDN